MKSVAYTIRVGSTFGAIKAATLEMQAAGQKVSCVHVRYMNPLSPKLGEMMPTRLNTSG